MLLCGCTAQRPSESASVILVSDPAMEWRLRRGFHEIEEGRWRWSQRIFVVECPLPSSVKREAAKLVLRFSVPPGLEPVVLSASVNGTELRPEPYRHAGRQIYSRRIPPSLFNSGRAELTFTLDHTFKPPNTDLRELGVMVESVGFE
jgi:hypothetical protein